jgi:hypothetical protein
MLRCTYRSSTFRGLRIPALLPEFNAARFWQPCVASRPKIMQYNSKPAVENNYLQRNIGGCTAAIFGEKWLKSGRKFFFL